MEPAEPGAASPQPVQGRLADVLQEKCEQLREQQRQLTLIEGGLEDFEPLPPPFHETFAAALPVEAEQAAEFAYATVLLARVYLPYRDPGSVPSWQRINGAVTLILRPGQWLADDGTLRQGFPYGSLPRLVLTWMTGEVLRTERRSLEAGASLYEFLGRIGLNPPGEAGKRWRTGGANARRMAEQMMRLFTAPFFVIDARDPASYNWGAFFVTDAGTTSPASAWGTKITVSERFFESIMGGCVPLDAKGLRALRGSPLRLDIYTWLAHRLGPGRLKKPTPPIPWESLARQFGGDYKQVRQFKAQFVRQLAVVRRDAYPAAKVDVTDKGLILRPSKPAVPKRTH